MIAPLTSIARPNPPLPKLPNINNMRFGKGGSRNVFSISSCRTFCLSRTNGQYILLGNGPNLYLSNNYGKTFNLVADSLNNSTANYSCLLSDDGKVILLYGSGLGISANSFYLSTTGGPLTLTSPTGTTAASFTLTSACISAENGQYIFLSGSGTSGGIYVSSNMGTSFVSKITSTIAHSCDCSPSGKLVVLSLNGGTPYYSKNFGSTFSPIGTTSFNGRRVYVHPDERYFSMRCLSSFVYVNLNQTATTLLTATTPSFSLSEISASTTITNTQADTDGTAALDRNTRLYYISVAGKICYANSTLDTQTEEPAFSTQTFTDRRISATFDGRLLAVFTGKELRILKQFHDYNTVRFLNSPVISSAGSLSFSAESTDTNLPLVLYWTPTTSLSQPQTYAAGTANPISFSNGGFQSGNYTFTISTLTETNGLINGSESLLATNNRIVVTTTAPSDVYGSATRYTFTDTTTTTTIRVNQTTTVRVLLVGGGGGGGGTQMYNTSDGCGGGGAGELAYGSLTLNANTTYNVNVGAGGTGTSRSGSTIINATSGNTTSITLASNGTTLASALGGGFGGNPHTTSKTGSTGGSSGGACGYYAGTSTVSSVAATSSSTPASGWTRLVNQGGPTKQNQGGGGGGGAGAAGVSGDFSASLNNKGTGGAGKSVSEFSTQTFAKGGDGGRVSDSGSDGTSATSNTGNGGNGGSDASATRLTTGGNGGSGIAIILFT